MADSITTVTTVSTVPSGTIIATDDAGASGHVQLVKLALSADGSATPITADANGLEVQGAGTAGTPAGGVVSVQGVASGTALPVSAASLPLPSGAATLAEQQSQTTALQLLDDTVYTDGTGTPSKAIGVAGTDGTNPQILKTDTAGELQVDVLTLPNVTIGAALPAGTNNIGDVDVLTVPAPLSTTGGGTEATALRVTLASDSTGVVSVDDNGGSLTVDGTVAVTNTGTFPVQVDGAALTALQLIDDVVVTEDAAHTTGDKGVMALGVRRDANTSLVGTDGDYAPLQVDSTGSLKVAIISGAGSGGTSATDDAAFTVASGSGTPIMGLADETAPDSVDEGDVGVVRMTLARALHVAVQNTVTVDGSGVTQPVSHAALTELAAAIDTEVQCDIVGALPAGTNNIGDVDVLSLPAIPAGTNNIGDVDVASLPKASGATVSSVADTATSTTLLSANGDRLGASIQNDSSAVLYIKCGTTASSTDYSARLVQYSYWEAPFGYTGRIDGIWASDPGDGAARITEFTA